MDDSHEIQCGRCGWRYKSIYPLWAKEFYEEHRCDPVTPTSSKPRFIRVGDGWFETEGRFTISLNNSPISIRVNQRDHGSTCFFPTKEEAEAYVKDFIKRMGAEEV